MGETSFLFVLGESGYFFFFFFFMKQLYIIKIEYKEFLLTFTVESHVHNNVFTYWALGTISNESSDLDKGTIEELEFKYPDIHDKIVNFFRYDEENKYPKNSQVISIIYLFFIE